MYRVPLRAYPAADGAAGWRLQPPVVKAVHVPSARFFRGFGTSATCSDKYRGCSDLARGSGLPKSFERKRELRLEAAR
jgi:hypothetical protein